jgi:hypothetical protein
MNLFESFYKTDPFNLLLRQVKLRRFDEKFIEPQFGND